jgi:hypothetical protein
VRPDCCAATAQPPTGAASKRSPCSARSTPKAGWSSTATGSPGGGVTAGLDFGLVVLARLLGEEVAKVTSLMLEYAPAPPFDAGTPETAGPELTAMARAGNRQVNEEMTAVAEQLAAKGWGRAA